MNKKLKKYVTAALWVPPIATLWAGAGALLAAVGRYAVYGEVPPIPGGVNTTLVATGVAGAIALLYYIVLTETFGEETVEQAQENVRDLTDGDDDAD